MPHTLTSIIEVETTAGLAIAGLLSELELPELLALIGAHCDEAAGEYQTDTSDHQFWMNRAHHVRHAAEVIQRSEDVIEVRP